MTQFNAYLLKRPSLIHLVIVIFVHCSHPSHQEIILMHEGMNMDAFVFLCISLPYISPKEIYALRTETVFFSLTSIGCMILDK